MNNQMLDKESFKSSMKGQLKIDVDNLLTETVKDPNCQGNVSSLISRGHF